MLNPYICLCGISNSKFFDLIYIFPHSFFVSKNNSLIKKMENYHTINDFQISLFKTPVIIYNHSKKLSDFILLVWYRLVKLMESIRYIFMTFSILLSQYVKYFSLSIDAKVELKGILSFNV